MFFLIIILAIFFATNMGGASFAASFAAPYGGKIISRKNARLLFFVFVILGAVLFGKNVSMTLGTEIIPLELLDQKVIVIIFLVAGLSMFVSNRMNIPQSTSLVTVAAIAGVGAAQQQIDVKTLYYLVPFWILLPVVSYFITLFISSLIYPPRRTNFWVYEKFINHQDKLKRFVILSSCYNAFSVGTNNVANVAGPLFGAGDVRLFPALFIFACLYGLGAFAFSGPIKTAGDKIVPLGLLTASIISLVSGSLMIFASLLGVPQSFVMLQMGALFAISSLKHGPDLTFENTLTKKTFYTWTINPIITFFVSFVLTWLIIH